MPPSLRRFLLAASCALTLAFAAPLSAQLASPAPAPNQAVGAAKARPLRDPALYRAEVVLNSPNPRERDAGIGRGLAEVVVKLTGDPKAPTNPVIRRALANAETLLDESSSDVDASDHAGNTAIGGVPVFKTTLSLSFDPAAVDALIAGAGLKYWTGVRPKPLLWLAIDDGRGPRLVTGQQTAVVRPLAQRGLERGLRFSLPAGSAAEAGAVSAIWALDGAALAPLTARYQNDTQLVGKMYRSVSGWSAWWVLSQGGVELARWPVTDADPNRVIASGADPAADALAKRDAVPLDIGPAGQYLVDVVGVQGQDDYLRLMAYLETLPILQSVSVVEAVPDHLRLSLSLGVGLKGLRMLVGNGDILRALADPSASADGPAEGAVPRYQLLPPASDGDGSGGDGAGGALGGAQP